MKHTVVRKTIFALDLWILSICQRIQIGRLISRSQWSENRSYSIKKKPGFDLITCVPNREYYCQQKTKKCSGKSMNVLFWSSAPRWSFFRLLSRFQKVNKIRFGKAKKKEHFMAKKTSFSNPNWMPWQYSLLGTLLMITSLPLYNWNWRISRWDDRVPKRCQNVHKFVCVETRHNPRSPIEHASVPDQHEFCTRVRQHPRHSKTWPEATSIEKKLDCHE